MKKSSKAALLLIVMYIAGAIACDIVLAAQYKSTDLDDPLKNFSRVDIAPFNHLFVAGGNGYAVEIRQGEKYQLLVMNSRKSFFKNTTSGDTLHIAFSVANQNYQSARSCPVGLIIIAPTLNDIHLSGTNTIIGPFKSDSLLIRQDGQTFTRMRHGIFSHLKLMADQESIVDLETENSTSTLSVASKGRSEIIMHEIAFDTLVSNISDSSRLSFFKTPFENYRPNAKRPDASGQ